MKTVLFSCFALSVFSCATTLHAQSKPETEVQKFWNDGDVTSDIKLKGGQQIGGKSKMALVAHKVKGQWLIIFDSQTPVMDMSLCVVFPAA